MVDNKSNDNSVNFIKEKFESKIIIIENSENYGFGKANNIGVKVSKGNIIVLLNSDTIVTKTDFNILINSFYEDHYIGFLGAKILNKDDTIQSLGFAFPKLGSEFIKRLFMSESSFVKKMRYKSYKNIGLHSVDWLSGSFMLIRREDYLSVNGFDESIFMYSEDLDICYRLGVKGKKNKVNDLTCVHHLKGMSSNNSKPEFRKILQKKTNYIYIIKKNNMTRFIFAYRVLIYYHSIISFLILKIKFHFCNKKTKVKSD
jgi:GT2 family glycosyltransferase